MENKIQQLTEKLYSEGVQKGKSEADKLITEAHSEADRIIKEAEAKAQKIVATAEARDSELATNTRKELVLAGNQFVSDIKQSVREQILSRTLAQELNNSFNNPNFISNLVEQLVIQWGKGGTVEVPADMNKEIDGYLRTKLSKELSDTLVIKGSASLKGGFRVEMTEGNYYINFGKEEFEALLSDYLRPRVSKLIFGEE